MGGIKKSKAQLKYDKISGLCAYNYTPTEEEKKAYDYCIRNDIRISPIAAEQGMTPVNWYVGISDPSNYKKIYKSCLLYTSDAADE